MSRYLSRFVVAALVLGLGPAPRAMASLSQENLKNYVARVGARVESAKANVLVTSMPAGKGRIEIRLLNDAAKQRLGLYAYGFGNAATAEDQNALYAYLLKANSELAIGSFFVDKDDDIGYKFMLDTRDPLSYETFELVYLAMVNVIKERGPVIAHMAGKGQPAPKQDEQPPEPPGQNPGTFFRR